MMGGIDQQVKQAQLSAGSDPQQLAQRYKKTRSLIDLLAMQKMKSDKEAATKEMQMQMQNQPKTIIEQREAELMGQTQQEIQQKIAPGMAMAGKASMPQQGMPQQGPPQGMPQQGPQGTGFARGGIVSFAGPEGSFVEEPNMFGLEGGTEVMGYDGQPKLTHTGEQRTTAMKRQIDKALEELMARGASPQEAIAKVSNFIRSPNSPEGEYLQQLKDEVNAKAPDLAQRPPAEPMSIPSPAPSINLGLDQLFRSKGDTPQPPPVAQRPPLAQEGIPPALPPTPNKLREARAKQTAGEGFKYPGAQAMKPSDYSQVGRGRKGPQLNEPTDFAFDTTTSNVGRGAQLRKTGIPAALPPDAAALPSKAVGPLKSLNNQEGTLGLIGMGNDQNPALTDDLMKPPVVAESDPIQALVDSTNNQPMSLTPEEQAYRKAVKAANLKGLQINPKADAAEAARRTTAGQAGSRAKMGEREKKLEGLEKLMAIYNDPDKLWREKGYAMLAGAGGQTTASGALGGLNIAGLNATNRQQEGLKNDYLSVLKQLDSQYKDTAAQEGAVNSAYDTARDSSQRALSQSGVTGAGLSNKDVTALSARILAEGREKTNRLIAEGADYQRLQGRLGDLNADKITLTDQMNERIDVTYGPKLRDLRKQRQQDFDKSRTKKAADKTRQIDNMEGNIRDQYTELFDEIASQVADIKREMGSMSPPVASTDDADWGKKRQVK